MTLTSRAFQTSSSQGAKSRLPSAVEVMNHARHHSSKLDKA
jgi:hypothetical protein